MGWRLVSLCSLPLLAVACAPAIRHDKLGTGTAVIGGGAGGGVAVPVAGPHEIAWSIDTPHAMRLAWAIDCGGARQQGVVGETLEAYRERRLNDLRAEKQREQRLVSGLVGTAGAAAGVS